MTTNLTLVFLHFSSFTDFLKITSSRPRQITSVLVIPTARKTFFLLVPSVPCISSA